jgi:hypothetical protein
VEILVDIVVLFRRVKRVPLKLKIKMVDLQTLIDDPRIPKKTLGMLEFVRDYQLYHTTRPNTGEDVFFVVHCTETNCNGNGGNIYQLDRLIPWVNHD